MSSALLVASAVPGALVAWRVAALAVETRRSRRLLSAAQEQLASATAALAEQALTDPLTGLANRRALLDQLERLVGEGRTAVWFFDLDRFKVVNDSLGHAAGDALLLEVGRRLQRIEAGSPGSVCARLGGDEFVLAGPVDGASPLRGMAEDMLATLAEPIEVVGTELYVNASVGIAVSGPGVDAAEVLRNADAAMHAAKAAWRDRVTVFDASMRAGSTRRLGIESELRAALEGGDLGAHYQPIVDAVTGDVVAVEALLRWTRGGEMLRPAAFLDVAEDSGLIVPIGEQMLNMACQQLAAWDSSGEAGVVGLDVYVNLSGRQLTAGGRLHSVVHGVLATFGLDPSRLVLEVNENALMHNVDFSMLVLEKLAADGVRIAIDDFGTGVTSLAHVTALPLWAVKLDRELSLQLASREDGGRVLGSLVELLHGMGRDVIVEGVEERSQLDAALAAGVDLVQGYLTGRPMASRSLQQSMIQRHAPGPPALRVITG
jgi:diguanylate cyclase (GGDEF)-like protein